jgi:2-amino-4-hydroxy-6-hydroxymethyldihydropteridine diphosphokinase
MAEPVAARWLIALGSNAADAAQRLAAARTAIAALGDLQRVSAPREGADIEGRGPPYLNQVLELATALDADALRQTLRQIETDLGRDRSSTTDCALDLDLLARIDAGIPAFLDAKPLRIPEIRAALQDWHIVA